MIEIYKGNIIFTKKSHEFEVYKDSFIVVKRGIVKGIYKHLPIEYKYIDVKDYSNCLIIPGMNDLHCHAPQFRNIGIAMDKELIPWLYDYTFVEESKYKDINYAQKMYKNFIKEVIRQGTTRISVFATIHKEATKKLLELFIESNMGAYVGKVNMDANSPEYLIEDSTESITNTIEIINEYKSKSDLVKPIITPRFIPSCTNEVLRELGKISLENNLPVQSHLSENQSEIKWVKELHPKSKFYGDAYNRYDLFGQTPTLMAHCVHTGIDEMNLMRRNNVFAVHCPLSNLNLSSGITPVRRFLNNNITVVLGTDASGGSSLSIFKTIVSSIQLSKLQWANSKKEEQFLSLSEAFYMATKAGGSFFGKVGSFEYGYEFDALIIDDSNLCHSEYSLLERLERFIYIGDDRNIKDRYVKGNLIDINNLFT